MSSDETQEQAESRIELHDDPDLLAHMLDFCYTRKDDTQILTVQTCLHHAQLYTLGDKYGMSELRSKALKGLLSVLKTVFDTNKAESIEPEKIEPAFVDDLLATIHHIYHNTLHSDMLRKMLACIPWRGSTMNMYKDQVTELLRDNPEYAWDVIIYSGDKIEDYSGCWPIILYYTCPVCSAMSRLDHEMDADEELTCYDCSHRRLSKGFDIHEYSDKPQRREEDMAGC